MTVNSIAFVIGLFQIALHADEKGKWVSSNPNAIPANACEVNYKLPDGFIKDEDLTKQAHSLAVIVPAEGERSQSLAIDYTADADSISTFDKYRSVQVKFLKGNGVDVEVDELRDRHPIGGEKETIYEKWQAKPGSKFMVQKKVYRVKKAGGYYSISLNSNSAKLLKAYPFDNFLEGISLVCKDAGAGKE